MYAARKWLGGQVDRPCQAAVSLGDGSEFNQEPCRFGRYLGLDVDLRLGDVRRGQQERASPLRATLWVSERRVLRARASYQLHRLDRVIILDPTVSPRDASNQVPYAIASLGPLTELASQREPSLTARQCHCNLLPCLPSNPFSSPIQRDEFDPGCLDRLLNCSQGRGPGLSRFRLKVLDGAQAHLGCLCKFALRDVEQPPRGAALARRYVSLLG